MLKGRPYRDPFSKHPTFSAIAFGIHQDEVVRPAAPLHRHLGQARVDGLTFHTLALDGVYIEDERGELIFLHCRA